MTRNNIKNGGTYSRDPSHIADHSVWFVAILGAYRGTNFFLQRVEEQCTGISQWMSAVGQLLESEAPCESWSCSIISDRQDEGMVNRNAYSPPR